MLAWIFNMAFDYSCQPIRGQVRKSWVTNMDFNTEMSVWSRSQDVYRQEKHVKTILVINKD